MTAAVALVFAATLWTGCAHLQKDVAEVHLSPPARAAMQALISERPDARAARAIAPTGSMAPTLDEHFIAIVEKRPFRELKVGDIIGEYYLGEVFAHRIVRQRNRGMFTTKGDALKTADAPVLTPASYSGEVVIAAVDTMTGEVRLMRERPQQWSVARASETSPAPKS